MHGYHPHDQQQASSRNIPRNLPYNGGQILHASRCLFPPVITTHRVEQSNSLLNPMPMLVGVHANEASYSIQEQFPIYPEPRWPPAPQNFPAPNIRFDTSAMQHARYMSSSSYAPGSWAYNSSAVAYPDSSPYAMASSYSTSDLSDMAPYIPSPTYSNAQLSPGALTSTGPPSPASLGLGQTSPPHSPDGSPLLLEVGCAFIDVYVSPNLNSDTTRAYKTALHSPRAIAVFQGCPLAPVGHGNWAFCSSTHV